MKAILASLILASAAFAAIWLGGRESHAILLSDVVAAPVAEGHAVFLKIDNGGVPDTLLSVQSTGYQAELTAPDAESGLPVPMGQTVSLAPDAAHVTIVGGALAEGQLIPLTLDFATAGEIRTKARVIAPIGSGSAAEVGLFGLGDICIAGPGEPAPKLSISVKEADDGWQVMIDAEEFTFSRDLAGAYHVPGVGHGHLYVGGLKHGRLYENQATIGTLPSGTHMIRVTLNTNDHRAYVVDDEPVTATATITIP